MARKHNVVLSPDLHDFLIGSLLGDGSFVQKTERHNCYIVFSQCANQLEYLKWKYDFLDSHGAINSDAGIKKVCMATRCCYPNAQDQYRFSTKSCPEFNQYKHRNRAALIDEINELGLVVYMLDDGNIDSGCIKISCGTLNEGERTAVCNAFNRVAGVMVNIYKHPNNPHKDYFRITSRYYDLLRTMAMKYVPDNTDIMMRKFGGLSGECKSKVS